MTDSHVLVSGFSDEAAPDKTMDQQFSVMTALGLRHVSIRFVDCGSGVKNVLDLQQSELATLRQRLSDYGLSVSSIGSPIGKVLIADIDDGTGNRFVPFEQYLREDVARAIEVAQALNCRLIRGFSFYQPRDQSIDPWLGQAVEQIGRIAESCEREELTFGLEVEANLIGHTGQILRTIYDQVANPALALVFDGGNLVTQGYSSGQILDQFRTMLPGLGWMHVKDYSAEVSSAPNAGYIDEEQLNRFVPADCGGANHLAIFEELREHLPQINQRLRQRQIEGFFVDLEPHLRGGGQFGGYSGPAGMGVAFRALGRVLQTAGVPFQIRDWAGMSGD